MTSRCSSLTDLSITDKKEIPVIFVFLDIIFITGVLLNNSVS